MYRPSLLWSLSIGTKYRVGPKGQILTVMFSHLYEKCWKTTFVFEALLLFASRHVTKDRIPVFSHSSQHAVHPLTLLRCVAHVQEYICLCKGWLSSEAVPTDCAVYLIIQYNPLAVEVFKTCSELFVSEGQCPWFTFVLWWVPNTVPPRPVLLLKTSTESVNSTRCSVKDLLEGEAAHGLRQAKTEAGVAVKTQRILHFWSLIWVSLIDIANLTK